MNVLEEAVKNDVKFVIGISTDKADKLVELMEQVDI